MPLHEVRKYGILFSKNIFGEVSMKRFQKIYLEISNLCNLRCTFCPGTKRDKHALTEAEFSFLMPRLRPWTAGACHGTWRAGFPFEPSRKEAAGRLPSSGSGGAQKSELITGKGVGLVSVLSTTVGDGPADLWGLRLL